MDPELQAALDALAAKVETGRKGLSDSVASAIERLDKFELRMNRPGAPDTGRDPPAERKQAVEALGEYGRTGEIKAMSAVISPEGGYTMAPALAAAIRERAAQVSPIRSLANVITLTDADTYEEPAITDLGDAEWVSEKAARPETSTPSLAKTVIDTDDLYCNPPVTQRLLDNSHYDVGAALVRRIGKKFAQKEGAAFVAGDGVGKPRGIVTYDTTDEADSVRAWHKLQFILSNAATDVTADALIDMSEELAPEYRGNARWLMSRRTGAKVRKLKSGDGDYLWRDGLLAGQPPTLLGYPVAVADDMPAVGAGAFPIAFGDFMEGYAVVDAARMMTLRDPYTNKPFVHFYTVERVGGGVLDFDAIKLLKIGA